MVENYQLNSFEGIVWLCVISFMLLSVTIMYKIYIKSDVSREKIIKTNFDYANEWLSLGYCTQCECLLKDEKEEVKRLLNEVYGDVEILKCNGHEYFGRRCFKDFKVHT